MAARYYLITDTAKVTFSEFPKKWGKKSWVSSGAAQDMALYLNTRLLFE